MIHSRFITFEGGEGSGKSTQIKLLSKKLSDYGNVVVTREPGGTQESEKIRKLLVRGHKDRWDPIVETLLLFAARKEHVSNIIIPSLKKGNWVLCDRFNDSTTVYQGLGKNVNLQLINYLEKATTQNLKPFRTFYLDIDPKIGLSRSNRNNNKELRYESMSLRYHNKVRRSYLNLAKKYKNRIKVINANKSIQEIEHNIWNEIQKLL